MHTCPLVSVFNEYIYIRYGRKIGFSWMYDWCWHSQVVANNLIVKSVQKMTFCHAEFGRNGAEKNPFFAIIRISINGFSRKKTYNQEKTTHIFHTKQWIFEKKHGNFQLGIFDTTEGKTGPTFSTHTGNLSDGSWIIKGLMPCHNSGVGT